MNKSKTKIAIIPAKGLGDALLFLIIANNLQRNGYQVTFFSDFIAQLQDWFSDVVTKPFPDKNEIDSLFSKYDFVISDTSSVIVKSSSPAQYQELAKKCVFINMSMKIDPNLICHYSENNKLLKASGTAMGNIKEINVPLVTKTAAFCEKTLQLENTTKSNGIEPPAALTYRKHSTRIVLHPTGTSVKRWWPAKKYIKLARRLRKDGWQPAFCVSPAERPTWHAIVKDEFLLPEFPTVNELANFVYESGYMIGNCSGIGHLASCLHVPTLTIWKRLKNLRWRPGWFVGDIVKPAIKLPFCYGKYWHYLLSVRKVRKSFKKLVKKYNMTQS